MLMFVGVAADNGLAKTPYRQGWGYGTTAAQTDKGSQPHRKAQREAHRYTPRVLLTGDCPKSVLKVDKPLIGSADN